jgi:predicted nucleotidyltransferase
MTDAAMSNLSGLKAHELDLLRAALADSAGLTRAWLFGSRAKGTAGATSDIDIAVEGLRTNLEVEAARDSLNDLPLPYAVDVQAVEGIENPALREHIARCGVLVFERRESPDC